MKDVGLTQLQKIQTRILYELEILYEIDKRAVQSSVPPFGKLHQCKQLLEVSDGRIGDEIILE